MEYNITLYKIFKYIKSRNKWKYITTCYTYAEAYVYTQIRSGIYEIVKEESVD